MYTCGNCDITVYMAVYMVVSMTVYTKMPFVYMPVSIVVYMVVNMLMYIDG